MSAFQKGTALRRASVEPLLLGLRLLATSVALTLFRLEQVPFFLFYSPSGTSTANYTYCRCSANQKHASKILQLLAPSYLLLVETQWRGPTDKPTGLHELHGYGTFPWIWDIIHGDGTFRKRDAPRSTSLVGTTSAPREP